jgi:hypothetical protein
MISLMFVQCHHMISSVFLQRPLDDLIIFLQTTRDGSIPTFLQAPLYDLINVCAVSRYDLINVSAEPAS